MVSEFCPLQLLPVTTSHILIEKCSIPGYRWFYAFRLILYLSYKVSVCGCVLNLICGLHHSILWEGDVVVWFPADVFFSERFYRV